MSERLKLISGNSHRLLAEDLAVELGVYLESAESGAFADGDMRVHIASEALSSRLFSQHPRRSTNI